MSSVPPVSGAVLAGGRSRRMGRDKRLLPVDGEALLARTVRTLGAVAEDVTVVVADGTDRALVAATLGATRARVAVDVRPDAGPVAGLASALAAALHPWVLVVATDHPGLTPEVLRLIAGTAAAAPDRTAVAVAGPRGPEPLLACYRRDALDTVTDLLDGGVRRLVDVLTVLDPLIVGRGALAAVDPDGAALRDVDTPGDLRDG